MGVRPPLIVLAGVLGVLLVAGISGSLAVHAAHSPTGCVPLLPGDHNVRVGAGARARDVLVHVPPRTTDPLPLVVAVHGAGQSGALFALQSGFSRLADREHFIVAYPSTGGARPFWSAHGTAVARSLDAIETTACVQPTRVFLTGVSNGGGFTARFGCDLSGRLAGIAVVAGGDLSTPPCRPRRPLPMLTLHSSGDRVDRWLAGWRRVDRCRGAPRRTVPERGVAAFRWTRCARRTAVEQVRLAGAPHGHGAPHGWPGGDRVAPPPAPFSATWTTWAFFRGLPARAPA
jgi:polyhydroxybutyrate depolymerase